MKTWTTPELEELEVKETAHGGFPFFFESCLTHGSGCGGNGDNNPDGDGTGGDIEIPDCDDDGGYTQES